MRCQPIRLAVTAVSLVALWAGSAPSAARAEDCKEVHGHQVETPLVDGCASPVGLCTVAQMSGALKGEAVFTASSITGSADTPVTNVVFVTGDSVIEHARLAGKRGTLIVKNAAAFRTVADNDLVDVQTILGGTGDFAGATGSLRIRGDFVPGVGGSSTIEGVVCTP